jgi:hypothetical protein
VREERLVDSGSGNVSESSPLPDPESTSLSSLILNAVSSGIHHLIPIQPVFALTTVDSGSGNVFTLISDKPFFHVLSAHCMS